MTLAVLLCTACGSGGDGGASWPDKGRPGPTGQRSEAAPENPWGKAQAPFDEEAAAEALLSSGDMGTGWVPGEVETKPGKAVDDSDTWAHVTDSQCRAALTGEKMRTTGGAEITYESSTKGSGLTIGSEAGGYATERQATSALEHLRSWPTACADRRINFEGSEAVTFTPTRLTMPELAEDRTAVRMTLKRVGSEGWFTIIDMYHLRKGPNVSTVGVILKAGTMPLAESEVTRLLEAAAARL
ncbi:hypothetical protein ACIBI4_18825 [Streptomyces sp. NPDC050418]|uniref:hypothetical protein n=1 Tax=Streptomyces sp. NPDC050418 TaxID=3365612 RepID=UPI003791B590